MCFSPVLWVLLSLDQDGKILPRHPPQTMQHLIRFPEACSSSPQAAWSFTWFSVGLKSVQMDPNQFQVNVLKYQHQQKETAGFHLDPTFSRNISGLLHFL